ncbi:hypothetical protein [Streptomyces sp. NPDC086787]|uniref:hypothetical protein n=1 Tax=Streptomyces sp. NPDC086787 TaxID=3365759 RepID=UPI0038161C37
MSWRKARAGAVVAAGGLLVGSAAFPAHAVQDVACSTSALVTAISDANSGMDATLALTPYCVYTLTNSDGSLPTITKPLVIHGRHATIRRDPNATANFRVFDVDAASLTMDDLTVMNGSASPGAGGGVFLGVSGGSLTTTDVRFQGNAADVGGAIVALDGTSVSLTGGTVDDNSATAQGGGIVALGAATVTLDSLTMTGNRAGSSAGGALLDTSQQVTIKDSNISRNTGKQAGGGIVFGGSDELSITGTTIADNRVPQSISGGGGILFAPASGGSGSITDSTISGNTVTGFTANDGFSNRGGGIFSDGGPLTLDNTTVSGNQLIGPFGQGAGIAAVGDISAGTLVLQHGTAITGNLASGTLSQGGGLYTDDTFGAVSVSVAGSHIDGNKVGGTGSAAGGVFNVGGAYSFTTSSVNGNMAPSAPAPGGVSTTVAITSVDAASTFTGNTPTNCLLSPQPVTNCSG